MEKSSNQFESSYSRLQSVVQERLKIEWRYHRRPDIGRMESELNDLMNEYGELLRVVYRYGLVNELMNESKWYASVLASRGPGQDAFKLMVESWIIAINGIVKPPECHELTAPLQDLHSLIPSFFHESETTPVPNRLQDIQPFTDKLITGDRSGAKDILQNLMRKGMPPYETVTTMILPAMRDIGQRWEQNRLAIYEEHLATETLLRLLAGLSDDDPQHPKKNGMVFVSCVPHDKHQLVPLALSVYLELRQWNVLSLGTSLPGDQIALAVRNRKPAAVFLSLNMLSRLHEAVNTINLIRDELDHGMVFIGGHGADVGRAVLESAGAVVVRSFEEGHRLAYERLYGHAQ